MQEHIKEKIETEEMALEESRKHRSHHHHSSGHRHSSGRRRRKRKKTLIQKIKRFFRGDSRHRSIARRNPNSVGRKVMMYWIVGAVVLMILLIPVFTWVAESIAAIQAGL